MCGRTPAVSGSGLSRVPAGARARTPGPRRGRAPVGSPPGGGPSDRRAPVSVRRAGRSPPAARPPPDRSNSRGSRQTGGGAAGSDGELHFDRVPASSVGSVQVQHAFQVPESSSTAPGPDRRVLHKTRSASDATSSGRASGNRRRVATMVRTWSTDTVPASITAPRIGRRAGRCPPDGRSCGWVARAAAHPRGRLRWRSETSPEAARPSRTPTGPCATPCSSSSSVNRTCAARVFQPSCSAPRESSNDSSPFKLQRSPEIKPNTASIAF